jgi:hypothetical protein
VSSTLRSKDLSEKLKIRVVYEPTKMGILVGDNDLFSQLSRISNESEKDKFLMENYSITKHGSLIPPSSLTNWLQKTILSRPVEYSEYAQLKEEIASMLVALEAKIKSTDMYPAFWDGPRRKQPDRKPKEETKVHPTLAGLISDHCLMRHLDFNREPSIGGGEIDFYISGYIKGVGIQGVCVEVKNAHAQKERLKHGISSQLPTYMQSKGADFGIYLVLWYKGQHFDEPKRYDDYHQMENELHSIRNKKGLGKPIRILTLNLSDSESVPSDIMK